MFERAAECGAEKLREYIRYALSLSSITQSHTLETKDERGKVHEAAFNRKPDFHRPSVGKNLLPIMSTALNADPIAHVQPGRRS